MIHRLHVFRLSGFRYRDYRGTVFGASVMIAFALFFVLMGLFSRAQGDIYDFLPRHFTIDQRGGNLINHSDLQEIVRTAGGDISYIRTFSYLDADVFRYSEPPHRTFRSVDERAFLVSESIFTQFTGLNFSVARDEIIIVTNCRNTYAAGVYFETRIRQYGDSVGLIFHVPETRMVFLPFANSQDDAVFTPFHANVINDHVWIEQAVGNDIHHLTVFDLAHGDHTRVANALAAFGINPISQTQRHQQVLQSNRLLLLVAIMSGGFFFTAAIIMILYRLVSNVEKRLTNSARLELAGLSSAKSRSYWLAHASAVFGSAIFVGLLIGLIAAIVVA